MEEDLFRSIPVRELQDEDFLLASVERIVLKASGCSAVLFYTLKDPISKQLRNMWNELADSFAGINFFAVNASRRVNIMRSFQEVSDDLDHPLNNFRIRGYPAILIYREGGQPGISWPKAFYNGELTLDALQNWMLQLACTPGYTETPLIKEGIVTENEIQVYDERSRGGVKPASSLDFQSNEFRVDDETIERFLELQQEDQAAGYDEEEMQNFEEVRGRNMRIYQPEKVGGLGDPGFIRGERDDELSL